MTRVRVLGLGNVLMGDDGVGPYVVRALEAGWTVPSDVAVEDLGTPGLDLVPHVRGAEALIVVDAARTDEPPGTIRTWRWEDLMARPPEPRLTPHDPGLESTLRSLVFAGGAPRSVLLVGVVPERVEMLPELSAAVRAAVPRAIETVRTELARLGTPARPRAEPAAPDLWWTAPQEGRAGA